MAPRPPRPPREERKPAASPGARRLTGRVAVRTARELVVEVAAGSEPLSWDPRGIVMVELADGTTVAAKIQGTTTTRTGTLAAGASARLTLDLPEGTPAGDVRRVLVTLGGHLVTVDC